MNDEIDYDWLARYLAGDMTLEEAEEVTRWAAASPERRAVLADLQLRWRVSGVPARWDVDAAWASILHRVARDGTDAGAIMAPSNVTSIATRSRNPARVILRIAAAAVLMVGSALVWRIASGGPTSGTPALASSSGEAIRTGIGERRAIDLPDGSHVVLGAASELRLGESFGAAGRDVHLLGQAFFRVTHDSTRPFRVHAAGTVAEDLGTEFDVRAYPGDAGVRVVVAEGVVAVHRTGVPDTAAVLRARDVARVSARGTEVHRDQPIERLVAWTGGELAFDDVELTGVCEELERWYDIECRVADGAVGRLHYTGAFRSEALDVVLGVVQASVGVRAERRGRVVTFSARTGAGGITVPRSSPRPAEAGA
jgi:transmembrane sensor